MTNNSPTICIIGMGYVGLPLAVEFAKHFKVTGLDICAKKITDLQNNHDETGEIETKVLTESTLTFSTDPSIIQNANIIIDVKSLFKTNYDTIKEKPKFNYYTL